MPTTLTVNETPDAADWARDFPGCPRPAPRPFDATCPECGRPARETHGHGVLGLRLYLCPAGHELRRVTVLPDGRKVA